MGDNITAVSILFILSISLAELAAIVPFILAMIKRKKSYFIASITGSVISIVVLFSFFLDYMVGGTTMGIKITWFGTLIIAAIVTFIIALIKKNRLIVSTFVLSIFIVSYVAVNFGIPVISTLASGGQQNLPYNPSGESGNTEESVPQNPNDYEIEYFNSNGFYFMNQDVEPRGLPSEIVSHPDAYTTVTRATHHFVYGVDCEYDLVVETTNYHNNAERIDDDVVNKVVEFIPTYESENGYIFDFAREFNNLTIDKGVFVNLDIAYLSLSSRFTITNDTPFENCKIDVLKIYEDADIPDLMELSTSYLYTLFYTCKVNYIVPDSNILINNYAEERLKAFNGEEFATLILYDYYNNRYFLSGSSVFYKIIFMTSSSVSNPDEAYEYEDDLFITIVNSVNFIPVNGAEVSFHIGSVLFSYMTSFYDDDIFKGYYLVNTNHYLFVLLENHQKDINTNKYKIWKEENNYFEEMTGCPVRNNISYGDTFLVEFPGEYLAHSYYGGLEYTYVYDIDGANHYYITGFIITRQGIKDGLCIELPDIRVNKTRVTDIIYFPEIFNFLKIDELHLRVENAYPSDKIVRHCNIDKVYLSNVAESTRTLEENVDCFFYDTVINNLYEEYI